MKIKSNKNLQKISGNKFRSNSMSKKYTNPGKIFTRKAKINH